MHFNYIYISYICIYVIYVIYIYIYWVSYILLKKKSRDPWIGEKTGCNRLMEFQAGKDDDDFVKEQDIPNFAGPWDRFAAG